MAYDVKIYNNSSDPRKVHKSLTLLKTYADLKVTSENGVEAPTLKLEMFADIHKANYAYIGKYGRYYFLHPTVDNGNTVTFTCESDPLSTFWNTYSGSQCVAERSTSNPNPEIVDEMLPFKSQPKIIYRKLTGASFTPGANTGSYVLCIGGK